MYLRRTKAAPAEWARAARFAAGAITVVLLAFGAAAGFIVFHTALGHEGTVGLDFTLYQERTASWLGGTGFYQPHQLAGEPYPVTPGDAYYPPVLLYLTTPFALGLPAVLWWAVPFAIIGATLWRMRPAWWAWPILAALLVYPRTWMVVLYGNPSLWAFAFLAAGLVWRWPAAFVPLKLTLAPFALVGIRARSWWIGAALALALCVPFGSMWLDWWTATTNVKPGNGYGLEYLLGEWPIALALVVALSSRGGPVRRPGETTASSL